MLNQKGFLHPFLIAASLIIVIPLILFGIGFFNKSKPNNSSLKTVNEKPKESSSPILENQSFTLNREQQFSLPSDAYITLNSYKYITPNNGEAAPEIKTLDHHIPIKKRLKIAHGGYVYDIQRSACTMAGVNGGDVVYQATNECTFTLKTTKETVASPDYEHFTKQFSSDPEQHRPYNQPIEPIRNTENEPFFRIYPEYIHIFSPVGSDPEKYQWGSGGFVTVYTAYGSESLKFQTVQEILNKSTISATIGPLKLTLKIDNFTCTEPYAKRPEGCGQPEDVTVINKLDYTLTITQQPNPQFPIQILDFE